MNHHKWCPEESAKLFPIFQASVSGEKGSETQHALILTLLYSLRSWHGAVCVCVCFFMYVCVGVLSYAWVCVAHPHSSKFCYPWGSGCARITLASHSGFKTQTNTGTHTYNCAHKKTHVDTFQSIPAQHTLSYVHARLRTPLGFATAPLFNFQLNYIPLLPILNQDPSFPSGHTHKHMRTHLFNGTASHLSPRLCGLLNFHCKWESFDSVETFKNFFFCLLSVEKRLDWWTWTFHCCRMKLEEQVLS